MSKPITIHHHAKYRRKPEDVWVAVSDSRALAEWFEPNDHLARVGHSFRFMVDGSEKRCEVLEADPPNRLVWSWRYVPNEVTGKPRQRGPMTICWTLEPVDGGTRLLLEHRNAENLGWMHRTLMRVGWKYMMNKSIPIVLTHVEDGEFSPGAIPLAKRFYKCETVPEELAR